MKEIPTPAQAATYDPTKKTIVEADSSSYTLSGCFIQEHKERLNSVLFCSRTLSITEQWYFQIGKECVLAVCVCERFDRYLMELESFTVAKSQSFYSLTPKITPEMTTYTHSTDVLQVNCRTSIRKDNGHTRYLVTEYRHWHSQLEDVHIHNKLVVSSWPV